MNPNPGRLLVFFMLLVSVACAKAPYEWEAAFGKEGAFVNEAVTLNYTCRFSDEGTLYTVDFEPPRETDAYRLYLLGEVEDIVNGKRVNEYRFVLFAKQPGLLELPFAAVMRKTTKESIEETVIGRDNVADFDFTDTAAQLPKVRLVVRENATAMTGSFELKMQLDTHDVRAFEPLPLTLVVEGSGNFDAMMPFELKIPGVRVFSEAPQREYDLGASGFSGRWVQRFALVAQEDFVLPPFLLRYFDPVTGKTMTLESPETAVRVTAAFKKEELLDEEAEEEAPPWQWEWSYLYYLLTLLAGMALGRWLRLPQRPEPKERTLRAQIERAENVKVLATVLVLSAQPRFKALIERLEQDPQAIALSAAKKEALEILAL